MGDTNEISKGCLTHYDNRHIQVRLDFLGLCAYDKDLFDEKRKEEPNQECMAKILRLFETLTDHARTGWQLKAINAKEKGLTIPQEPKEYRFELTNGAIISLIYNTFGESTVRNSLDHLVHLGYIGRYQEKKNSLPVYWLNTQKLQPLLKEQAENELSGFEITPQTTKGLKSRPKRPKSNPSSTISNPNPPKSDTSGFESTDNNISNNKDNITEKERNERESPPNTLDTHTIVSSDTAHAEYPLTEFDEKMAIKETEIRQMLEGQATEEIIQQTIETFRKAVLAHRETRYHELPIPTTYAEAVIYLAPHGGVPPGYDAVEVMSLAQKLYAEAHSQDEEMFRNETPQGDTHATRVPTVPRADHPAPGERHASGHPQSDNHRASLPADVPVVVHPVGSGTPGQEAGRDRKDTSPLTPAQSLPLPQAEQAALGTRTRTRKPAEPKPETPKSPPIEPPADMAWSTRKCLMWFDFWRGGILIGKWKLMQASMCAKGLAEQFDEQTVIQARTDMEADPYYAAKGGCDVCDVANNIHKYLKRHKQQQSKPKPVQPTNPNQPITNIRELVRQREALRAAALVGV